MMNTNSVLSAVRDMQPDAQAALPIIPRNGNPHGANNMPPSPSSTGNNTGIVPPSMNPQRRSPEDFYPWLQQSTHMDAFRELLQSPMYSSAQQQQPYTAQPVPQPAAPNLPILPQIIR